MTFHIRFLHPVLILGASLILALSGHAGPGSVETATKVPSGGAVANGDQFGSAAANLGDLDGDGVGDVAVGAPGDDSGGTKRGAVHILFLNANGTVKANAKIADNTGGLPMNTLANNESLGSSIANLGDLDGDRVPELAVGAPGNGNGGTGAVYVLFLNANGTVKESIKITDNVSGLPNGTIANGDEFGDSVTNLGDLDGDGFPELGVGAGFDNTGGSARGAVHILFLKADGTVKGNTKIADNEGGLPENALANVDLFGQSITNLGDLDGDCIPDIAVGAIGDGSGAVYILFLNANGTIKGHSRVADGAGGLPMNTLMGTEFGTAVAGLGDIDGDCIPDLAVGEERSDTGGSLRGAVHILFLNADGSVKGNTKIADGVGGLLPDTLLDVGFFGSAIANFGDLDGDTLPEIVVGARLDNTGGSQRGAIYLLNLGDLPFTVTTVTDEFDTPSLNGSGKRSLREAIRDADNANSGEFRTINFDPTLNEETITLTMGQLAITDQAVKITGEGIAGGVTISGGDASRVFNIDATSEVVLECLTIRDGNAPAGSTPVDIGGGIYNLGILSVTHSRITENTANDDGGGIFNNGGFMRITNSTIDHNIATNDDGGGIYNAGGKVTAINLTFFENTAGDKGGGVMANGNGVTALKQVTFSGNTATTNGGGVRVGSGMTVTIENSVIAGNTAGTADADISNNGGTVNAAGINLIGSNESVSGTFPFALPLIGEPGNLAVANLAGFGFYGGKTPTLPPSNTSWAIDNATFNPLPDTDQRGAGFPRIIGLGPDIGAVEFIPAPPSAAAGPDNSAARAALLKKIKKLKKKAKNAKRKGKAAKAKKLKKQIKKLTKQLRAL